MKTISTMILKISAIFVVWLVPLTVLAHPHVLDVSARVEISKEALLEDLRSVQVIFMGDKQSNMKVKLFALPGQAK